MPVPSPDGDQPPSPGDRLRSILGSQRLGDWIGQAAPSVIASWIAARVLVAISFVIGNALAPHVRLPFGRLHLSQGLVSWDGAYYRVLSEQGYRHVPREVVRFFPLFPGLSRAFSPLFGGRHDIALVVIANVGALVAMFLLWKLVTEMGYDRHVASRAVVLTALFPAAMCLVFAYAESVFLMALFFGAILLHRDRPAPAVVPLLAVGLLRPTGIMVSVAVLILAWQAVMTARREGTPLPWPRLAAWGAAIAAPVVGLASYLVWLEATSGRGNAPLEVQRVLRAGFREPVSRVLRAVWEVVTGNFRDVYNLAFVVVLIAAVVVAVRRRLPVAWTAYLVVGLVVACSANNIDSLGRYGMLLAPTLPLALGVVLSKRSWFVGAVAVGCVGFVWFTVVATLGQVVP